MQKTIEGVYNQKKQQNTAEEKPPKTGTNTDAKNRKRVVGLWGLEIILRGRRESVQKSRFLQTFPPNPFSEFFLFSLLFTRL
jgi:hypothetical protein